MEVQGEQRGRPQQLVGNLLEDSRKRKASYQITTTFHIHQQVMMVFLLKVPSIHKAVVVLILILTRYLLMKMIEQLRIRFETISNKVLATVTNTTDLLSAWHSSDCSPVAQLLSNKMCHWMNIHLQLLPNKFQLLLAQCGAASDPFPSRVLFIDEKSALYITEVMAEHEQTGMLIPSSYWPDYCKDLGILIQFPQIFTLLEALMTWQLTLQAKAHKYIMQHYPLGSNQPVEDNLANAQELIQGAQFVRDGIEEDIQAEYYKNTTH
ncbi:hypothetical protein F5141DRAFT_1061938 [Pisolithus sp. B1]|nr:hypothetical protein F5141DRAFT_1061938 [Pisolithus sp. B1]